MTTPTSPARPDLASLAASLRLMSHPFLGAEAITERERRDLRAAAAELDRLAALDADRDAGR